VTAAHFAASVLGQWTRVDVETRLGFQSAGGTDMKIACVTIVVASGILLAGGASMLPATSSAAFAQSTPRSVCCTQLNGRWEANRRTGEMRCFGVNTDQYYKCVASKTR